MKISRIFLTFLLVLCLTQNPSSSLAASKQFPKEELKNHGYFSSSTEIHENLTRLLQTCIYSAQRRGRTSVKLAMYSLTDPFLIKLLLELISLENVEFHIILGSKSAARDEKFMRYAKSKNRVFTIKEKWDEEADTSHMHLKLAIFSYEIDQRSHEVIATGSYNWTSNALHNNLENCIITEDETLVAGAKNNFMDIYEATHPNTSDYPFQILSPRTLYDFAGDPLFDSEGDQDPPPTTQASDEDEDLTRPPHARTLSKRTPSPSHVVNPSLTTTPHVTNQPHPGITSAKKSSSGNTSTVSTTHAPPYYHQKSPSAFNSQDDFEEDVRNYYPTTPPKSQ